MAVLNEADRVALWAQEMARRQCPPTLSKAEFRAAVDATDDWIDVNSGSFNTALPVVYRSAATARQKAELFAMVLDLRRKRV